MYNYFSSCNNSHGVPLECAIRKENAGHDDMDPRDFQIIYNPSLEWNMFTRYSKRVINIFKELTIGTYAATWIKGIKGFRKYTQEL